jgi:hypothetical protein
VATLSEKGFYICLQAGAATWVVAGETEDNRAGAIDIHGARAYHQTLFTGLPARHCFLIEVSVIFIYFLWKC